MKTCRLSSFFLAVIPILLLSSCGKDGVDGNAYMTFETDTYFDSYEDNNPEIASPIKEDHEYLVNPGNYNFTYYCSDGIGNFWEYSGTYLVTINEGTEAKRFKDGSDGYDRIYNFILTGTGFISSSGPRSEEITTDTKKELTESDRSNTQRIPIGDQVTETHFITDYQITITRQCYELRMPN